MHFKIGITGGIGVGKSTVCSIFEQLGVPIYYADIRAKQLMHESPELKKNIRQAFGWDTYDKKDHLNRSYLSKIVFNDPVQLNLLNSLVHPAVFRDYNDWLKKIEEADFPYSVKEAALMFETDSYKQMDQIIVVTCPINTRIERIMKRDHMKREEVLKRIENQLSDKDRLERANFVIKNSGKDSLILQCLSIHKQLLILSAEANEITYAGHLDS
jgi:dephospho-CoA kinase